MITIGFGTKSPKPYVNYYGPHIKKSTISHVQATAPQKPMGGGFRIFFEENQATFSHEAWD